MVAIAPGELVGGQYNSSGVALADGQKATLQVTSGGALIVSDSGGGSGPGGGTPVVGVPSTGFTPSQVTVSSGGTATSILAANTARTGCIIENIGSATVYLGKTDAVTSTTGFPLLPNNAFNVDIPLYTGAFFGICGATVSSLVGVEEMTP